MKDMRDLFHKVKNLDWLSALLLKLIHIWNFLILQS
jgi:hypothetical protein